jgi:hypothetical protein
MGCDNVFMRIWMGGWNDGFTRTMAGNTGIKRMAMSIDNVLLAAYELGLARPIADFSESYNSE